MTIPQGALNGEVTVTLSIGGAPPAAPYWGKSLGGAVKIDFGGATLSKPATLELTYQTGSPATGQSEDIVLIGYYDEQAKEWVPVGGKVDPQRQVVTVEITHASWWQPWSWVVDAIAQGIVTGFKLDWHSLVDAKVAFEGCVQSPTAVIIDESSSKVYLGSCVEVDDELHPRLRIVNRRTFDEKVYPVAGQVPSDLANPGLPLGRLERRSFNADFSGAPASEPLIVRAEVDWPATFGHALMDVFDLFPGLLPDAGTTQKVLLELYKDRDFTLAAEALSSGDDQTFRVEFAKVVTRTGELVATYTGYDLRLLFPVFRALGTTAIAIQFIDAATSARVGAGDLKFYSNRSNAAVNNSNLTAQIEDAASHLVYRVYRNPHVAVNPDLPVNPFALFVVAVTNESSVPRTVRFTMRVTLNGTLLAQSERGTSDSSTLYEPPFIPPNATAYYEWTAPDRVGATVELVEPEARAYAPRDGYCEAYPDFAVRDVQSNVSDSTSEVEVRAVVENTGSEDAAFFYQVVGFDTAGRQPRVVQRGMRRLSMPDGQGVILAPGLRFPLTVTLPSSYGSYFDVPGQGDFVPIVYGISHIKGRSSYPLTIEMCPSWGGSPFEN